MAAAVRETRADELGNWSESSSDEEPEEKESIPVFFPTWKEWQNFADYITEVEKTAGPIGGAKIVPPVG